jgi:hypothetical protein
MRRKSEPRSAFPAIKSLNRNVMICKTIILSAEKSRIDVETHHVAERDLPPLFTS